MVSIEYEAAFPRKTEQRLFYKCFPHELSGRDDPIFPFIFFVASLNSIGNYPLEVNNTTFLVSPLGR
jgi:hypothetical protein